MVPITEAMKKMTQSEKLLRILTRLSHVVKTDTTSELFKSIKLQKHSSFPPTEESNTKKTASWLRERVLQLGPTFIKIGQLSSTRSDLFPHEIGTELAKLQDRLPAFSSTKAKGLIERELGAPGHELFKEFEDQPIAAASLGQVHQVVLHTGERVVVKVQKPGLKKLFDIDLTEYTSY
ncbi:hypothetical protein L2E82_15879 [Cichorium intybus]|uniref:Uncharacterized protein n=1 Tax=Cichorium intybus TaxID=13427 RepID=A0ACB9F3B6_CICIN|nr:hypothetical protein L2E82_15879 [Cichorium intybus]